MVAHAAVVTSSPFKRALEESRKTTEVKRQKKETKENKDKQKKKVSKVGKKLIQEKTKGMKKKKNEAKPGKKKAESKKKEQEDEQDTRCLYCEELYSESVDGWIRCRVCFRWAHDLCAGTEDGSSDFVCELCLENN